MRFNSHFSALRSRAVKSKGRWKRMKNYELVYVVKPNSDDETKESVLKK